MNKGKHVLTEKPMGVNPFEALEMIRVSEMTGKTLGVCFQNRYNTTAQKIKEILDSGKAGRVLGAKAFVTWSRNGQYYTDSDWRGTKDKECGGVLINQAIHTIDLLQWFLGDLAGVRGNIAARLLSGIIEVEDTAEAVIFFKNGVHALLYATNCYVENSPVFIEIICEKALIRLNSELVISYTDGINEIYTDLDPGTGEKSYWGCGHKILIADFYSCLSEGREFSINGLQGINALKIVEGVYTSSATGNYVSF
jgi:predicted dehydrogenase